MSKSDLEQPEEIGCYVHNKCCIECDYNSIPLLCRHIMPMPPRIICPDCGGELKETIGRFKYKVIKEGFFKLSERTEFTGFIRGRE